MSLNKWSYTNSTINHKKHTTLPKQRMSKKIVLSETKKSAKYNDKLSHFSIHIPNLKHLNGWIIDRKVNEVSFLKNLKINFKFSKNDTSFTFKFYLINSFPQNLR